MFKIVGHKCVEHSTHNIHTVLIQGHWQGNRHRQDQMQGNMRVYVHCTLYIRMYQNKQPLIQVVAQVRIHKWLHLNVNERMSE